MKRREFIENAGILGSLAFVPLKNIEMINMKTYKLGYQLFSIRDEMAKDPISTLKALKEIGYTDFEAYGFDDLKGEFYGLKSAEFKSVLDDMGITVTSGHYNFAPYLEKSNEDLKEFVDRCIAAAKTIDSEYITWPWIAPEQRTIENFKIMADKLNLIGEQVDNAGLGFAYHNHGFEFEDHGGENGFDIILAATDAKTVKLQMDMYWVMHAAETTPKEMVSAQPGRYVMWHVKDMDTVTRDYTELGNGTINYLNLLPDPTESGLEHFYIEQGGNFTKNSMESARSSARYFQKNLKEFFE